MSFSSHSSAITICEPAISFICSAFLYIPGSRGWVGLAGSFVCFVIIWKIEFHCNRLYSERSFVFPSDFICWALSCRRLARLNIRCLTDGQISFPLKALQALWGNRKKSLSPLSAVTPFSPQSFSLVNKTINQPTQIL